MIPLRFGNVRFELNEGWSKVIFPDGKELSAVHAPQAGQEDTARELGFANAADMNRTHDLAHCIFAYQMGLPQSGSLYSAACRVKPTDVNWLEEAAVLAMQAFARAQGVDLVYIARKITAESDSQP